MTDPLEGCREKLRRARLHTEELDSLVRALCEKCSNAVVRDDQTETGQIVFRAGVMPDPPPEFSVRAGEILHNMRSSLDHLVCRLAEHRNEPVTKEHGFPICESAAKFNQNRRRLKGLDPAEIAVVESLQPYHTGHPNQDTLFILQFLNNADKHRLIIDRHVSPHELASFTLPNNVEKVSQGLIQHTEPGAEIATYRVTDGTDPSKVDMDFYARFAIYFREDADPSKAARLLPINTILYTILWHLEEHVFKDSGLFAQVGWTL